MLHFCDGFDSYTTSADFVKHKWHKYQTYSDRNFGVPPLDRIGAWAWSANEGVSGGGCAKHTGPAIGDELGTQFNYYPNEYNGRWQYSTLFWFRIATPPAERQLLCEWYQYSGYTSYRQSLLLFVNPDGTLSFDAAKYVNFIGFTPTTVYKTAINLCDDAWHCLEIMANFINTDRVLKIGIDDFVLADFIFNMTMNNAGAKCIAFYSIGVTTYIDDVIVWDEVGDTPELMPWGEMTDTRADEFVWDSYNVQPVNGDLNNFPERGQDDFFYWMGMRQITTLRPASDGLINDFDVVGAATQIDAVDDAMPEDGKYLTENQPGARMVFNLDDFSYDADVYAVVVNTLNKQETFGSIVAHAEALNEPNFNVGIRRRISGRYELIKNGLNLVPNGGPNFVDTTSWVAFDMAAASVLNGNLVVTNTGSTTFTDPDPFIEIAVPVTPNTWYTVTVKRPLATTDSEPSLTIRGGTVSGDQYKNIGEALSAPNSQTQEVVSSKIWYVPAYVSTLYLQIFPSPVTPGDYALASITIETLVPTFNFKYYQWAFRYNPTTGLEWDQAGINASEFGMRIAP